MKAIDEMTGEELAAESEELRQYVSVRIVRTKTDEEIDDECEALTRHSGEIQNHVRALERFKNSPELRQFRKLNDAENGERK